VREKTYACINLLSCFVAFLFFGMAHHTATLCKVQSLHSHIFDLNGLRIFVISIDFYYSLLKRIRLIHIILKLLHIISVNMENYKMQLALFSSVAKKNQICQLYDLIKWPQ